MTLFKFPGHKLFRCEQPCDQQFCCYCEGGLASCVTCGGAEASMPTDCPQRRLSQKVLADIQAGRLDYRHGVGWVMLTVTGRTRCE